jgi:hypothetical protein
VSWAEVGRLNSPIPRSGWRVERDGREFVYAEQMLGRAPAKVRLRISQAKQFAEKIGMPVQFFSGVLDYLK